MPLKNYKIITLDEVNISLQKQAIYIALEQQDPLMAQIWFGGIKKAISSLSILPERFSVAPENFAPNKKPKTIIRHLIYKKSFRIVFTTFEDKVIILAAKHSSKDAS